jgi:hypothetical protein
MADVWMSVKSYVKPLLHAAKYPHCAVNGLLLAEPTNQKDNKNLKITDAVPLFHSCLTLAPMMEIALTQVDVYCRNHNLVIAGYYQANEGFSESSPNSIAYRLAEKIKENYGDACLIMLDNSRALSDCENSYVLYSNIDGKWKKSDKRPSTEKDVGDMAYDLLQSRVYRELIDFDNHLDDITLDWQNLEINEHISRCV